VEKPKAAPGTGLGKHETQEQLSRSSTPVYILPPPDPSTPRAHTRPPLLSIYRLLYRPVTVTCSLSPVFRHGYGHKSPVAEDLREAENQASEQSLCSHSLANRITNSDRYASTVAKRIQPGRPSPSVSTYVLTVRQTIETSESTFPSFAQRISIVGLLERY
jgi:hypothetical protein